MVQKHQNHIVKKYEVSTKKLRPGRSNFSCYLKCSEKYILIIFHSLKYISAAEYHKNTMLGENIITILFQSVQGWFWPHFKALLLLASCNTKYGVKTTFTKTYVCPVNS